MVGTYVSMKESDISTSKLAINTSQSEKEEGQTLFCALPLVAKITHMNMIQNMEARKLRVNYKEFSRLSKKYKKFSLTLFFQTKLKIHVFIYFLFWGKVCDPNEKKEK